MKNPEMITVEKYAAMHRISIYQTIQKANSGELKAVIKEEEGKKITYIIPSDEAQPESADTPAADKPSAEEIDYKAAYEALQKEIEALKAKADKEK